MGASEGGEPTRQDRIFERMREDTERGGPARFVRFVGLVGEETADGYVRLYDPEDSGHVIEIPRNAIRIIEPTDPALTPIDGTSLWIDPRAECRHIVPDVGNLESFLAGEIAEGAYGLLIDDSGILRCHRWKSFSR
jgi:hypothetical protein